MGTQASCAVLLLAHLGAAATRLSGMVHSLAIVQPRARRFLGGAGPVMSHEPRPPRVLSS